jgi:hypothetical protein
MAHTYISYTQSDVLVYFAPSEWGGGESAC